MSRADIDIIIPVYNRAALVGRTLDSIMAQSVKPRRVILVDNNSTDNTAEVLEEYRRRMTAAGIDTVVMSETVAGAASARNRGLDASEAEYVMFFDSDDEMAPFHVGDFARALTARPDADIAGRPTLLKLLDGTTRVGKFTTFMPLFFNIFTGQMATQRYVVRRSLLEKAGRWNSRIMGWNDIELGMRLLLQNPVVIKVNGAPSVTVNSQADSITGSSFSSGQGKWERALDAMENAARDAARPDLVKWIDARRAILAAEYSAEGADDYAARLLNDTLASTDHPRRIKLIYSWQRRMRRLTWLLARIVFPC